MAMTLQPIQGTMTMRNQTTNFQPPTETAILSASS